MSLVDAYYGTPGLSNESISRYENEIIAKQRAASAAMEQQRIDWLEACRLAGGPPVHAPSRLVVKSGGDLLTTPCGGEWPDALKDSKCRPPEAANAAGITCHLCRAALGMPALKVTP